MATAVSLPPEITPEKRIAQLEEALGAARKGLFRIINISPTRYIVSPGGQPAIVKAFAEAQSVADRTVIAMSDATDGYDG
jgi:hypothetical protein